MNSSGLGFERLFAETCGRQFLRGFVFHSPTCYSPTEREVGDVVLWVRRYVVVIELISRALDAGLSTKQFVKRIGEKRDQLVNDHKLFNDYAVEIELTDEHGRRVIFDKSNILPVEFLGIVVVDCNESLERLHYQTVDKTLALDFSLAIMNWSGFKELLSEVDTVPDLVYYLKDRTAFLRETYRQNPVPFIDLNLQTEQGLLAFYKLHDNCFNASEWSACEMQYYPARYKNGRGLQIAARNRENAKSLTAIDKLADFLRNPAFGEPTLLHSWELASLSRRQRAGVLSEKILDAFQQLQNGRDGRYFAFYNQATECWLVFYFQYGGELDDFNAETNLKARQKLLVEMSERGFSYSVFAFGIRKSSIETGASFDNICLAIADADSIESIDPIAVSEAQRWFGKGDRHLIREFPDD